MTGRRWTREEDLAVLYVRHRGVKRFDHVVADLAEAMERTEASIWMRKGNFDSLDPSVPGVGLRSAAQLTKRVWAEYQENPQRVLAEARDAYRSLLQCGQSSLIREDPQAPESFSNDGLGTNVEEVRQGSLGSTANLRTGRGLKNWLRSLFRSERRS